MKRFTVIATILVFVNFLATARVRMDGVPFPQHYIDMQAGAGIGGLGYDLEGGYTQIAPSFDFGVGYTWFFLPAAGFQTGVHIARIASTAVLTEPMEWRTWQDDTRLTDYMGEEYTHRASFADWREEQQVWLIQIPLGLRFRHFANMNSRYGLHVAAGALLTIPLRANYTLASGEVTHTGWYENWRLLLHDVPGRFETEAFAKQKESFKSHLRSFDVSVYAEAGMLIRLDERVELILAAYVQWMPHDFLAATSHKRENVGFATERNSYAFMPEYHGIIGTDKTGALHPWGAGVKVGLSVWPGETSVQKRRCMCDQITQKNKPKSAKKSVRTTIFY